MDAQAGDGGMSSVEQMKQKLLRRDQSKAMEVRQIEGEGFS